MPSLLRPVTNNSEARREASRRNGAKSRGAVTPEGKAHAATANLRHGLYSRSPLLAGENPETFNAFLLRMQHHYQPVNEAELSCVEEIAECRWEKFRLHSMYEALMRDEVLSHIHETTNTDAAGCNGNALRNLIDNSDVVQSIFRIQSSLQRRLDRAHKSLAFMRSGKLDSRPRYRGPLDDDAPVPDQHPGSGGAPSAEPSPDPGSRDTLTSEPVPLLARTNHFDDDLMEQMRANYRNTSRAPEENKRKPRRRVAELARAA